MANIKKLFGKRVRELRKSKGLSQQELALKAGLDRTYVGHVELGKRNISLENIQKIAKALGVKFKDLCDFNDD